MKKQDKIANTLKALEQWHAAEHYLQNVSDEELIDFAVLSCEAARRKYMYMLKNLNM